MSQPNILFLMTDQMQGRVLNPDHPCITPNLDKLCTRGIRFTHAYTPNAVCSPARASLMTGTLPHNHGVLYVTHTVDDDQACLRTELPHWAQSLDACGYTTGYFGKWHIERSNDLARFGWQQGAERGSQQAENHRNMRTRMDRAEWFLEGFIDGPKGYHPNRFYGVCDVPPEERGMGEKAARAGEFLDNVMADEDPWCCFVSLTEPHDPFYCGQSAFEQYNVADIKLQPNVHDELEGRPGLYRKAARIWDGWSDQQHKEAAACYYASITEIDSMFGQLLDKVEAAGQMDNTIVIVTSDHGELLGAHGLYCKNICAAEEVYNIPLIVTGPGIKSGVTSHARVGLHDLCPTILDLADCEPFATSDSRSFASLLAAPHENETDFQSGYAEYFGGRLILTQRVVWNGPWKYVFNGFDFDELYNLDDDPFEMNNLAEDPACQTQLEMMVKQMWHRIEESGDHSLLNSHYPILRVAPHGPL